MRRFFRNIWNRLRYAPVAAYEAARQWWSERSWLNTSVQDARLDANAATRLELVRRHRYWVQNNGLVNRIRALFIQFSVGVGGLEVVPNSQNEEWNDNRKERWLDWAKSPELGTELPLGQLMVQWAGSLFDDGEFFIYKTFVRDDSGRLIPKIQTIEAHRVCTPPDLALEEGKTIVDGIRLKQLPGKDGKMIIIGRPKSYFVRDGDTSSMENYTEIPAEQMIHGFKARRPGMMRGIPEGFSTMNVLHDMADLQMYTMQKAKAAAIVMNVVTNAAGEVSPSSMRRMRLAIGTQDTDGTGATKQEPYWYDVKLAAHNIALKSGEDMKQFKQDEPGVVTQQYWDYLTSLVCCGYNVPKLLVTPFSLQGTVTRADLDICTNAFRMNFEIIKNALKEIYEWQTQWAVKFDPKQQNNTVDDMFKCEIRPPRAPNVDIGRNAQALILELEAGTVTYQDVFAERQQDWRDQFRQSAEAAAYIQKLSKEFGVPPEAIANKIKGMISEPEDKEPQKQEAIDE